MEQNHKESAISVAKIGFSAIPILGAFLNEEFFDLPGRLKQNRLNKFTELLTDYITKSNKTIDLENINKEDFADIFESILTKVSKTKSEDKLKRFRDVLFHCLENNIWDTENTERFLDLISNIKEYEVLILKYHSVFDEKHEERREKHNETKQKATNLEEELLKASEAKDNGFTNDFEKVITTLRATEASIRVFEEQNKQLEKYRNSEFYNLSDEEFLYSKQKLSSLGLLIDSGVGGIGTRPFQKMSITTFGKRFIEFITNSNS